MPPAPPVADEVDAWTEALLMHPPSPARRRSPASSAAASRSAHGAAATASGAAATRLDLRLAAIGAAAIAAGAPPPRRRSRSRSRSPGDKDAGLPCAAVRDAVRACVRAFLDPLFRAKAISREQYKAVARRATDKVCARHADAVDAAFLAREAPRVHALIQEYIRKSKSAAPPGATAPAAAAPPD
jgi:hypothetical protein